MPTYEYICDACHHEWEKFQPITSAAIKACPSCGKKKARRKISVGAGIIFKGSGFYLTDYRSDSYKAGEKAETEKSKPAETKPDAAAAKPETPAKPAATPAPAPTPKPAAKSSSAKRSTKGKSK